jgi:hypothetical protein
MEIKRYIPTGSMKIADKKSDAVAYIREATHKQPFFYALIYFGKQTKPVANYRYRSAEARAADVARYFDARQRAQEYTAKLANERKAWVNDYKIGEIVNTCWGYDQTNREYYEIVAVKGKNVTIRQIAVTSYATGWAQEQVAPLPGEYIGESKLARVSDRGVHVAPGSSYRIATRTSFTESVPGLKVYNAGHTSSYA